MKNISIYVCALLSLVAFSACNEDFKDWADPQSNPQGDAKNVTAQMAGVTADVVMDTYTEDSVDVAKLSTVTEGCKVVNYKMQMVANNKTVDLPYVNHDGTLRVAVAELDMLTEIAYNSRQSVKRAITLKTSVAVVTPTGEAALVDAGDVVMNITPVAPPVAEKVYYILGDFNGWSMPAAAAFVPVEGAEDTYSVEIEVAEKCNVKIFPKSGIDANDWSKALGADRDGDTSTSGLLDYKDKAGNDPGAICIETAGKKKVIINVKDYNYTIKEVSDLPETMYINGSAYSSDWNWGAACQMIPMTQTPGKFWTMQYYAEGEQIKFSPVAKWEGDFGYSAEVVTAEAIELAKLSENGGNIQIGKSGWYIVVVTVTSTDKKVNFLIPNVYMLGGVVNDSWETNDATLFTVPTDKAGEFISPAATKDGTARICVVAETGNWWKSEFTLSGGVIVYRENKEISDNLGELGYECKLTAGQKVHLKFLEGKGTVK